MVKRHRNLGYHSKSYLNMVRLTRKLVRLNPSDGRRRKALEERIESTEGLTEKQWLSEKLDELSG